MELSWSALFLIVVLLAAIVIWYTALAARELANEAAKETCTQLGAQMLEGTVAFRRLRPVRGHDGRFELERTYLFEYTVDGVTRRQGFVIVAGRVVESVGLEP